MTEFEKKLLAELKAKKELSEAEKVQLKELCEKEAKLEIGDLKKELSESIGKTIAEEIGKIKEIISSGKMPVVLGEVHKETSSFQEVLVGILKNDKRIIDKYKMIPAKKYFESVGDSKALSEGTNSAGGYLVPVEQSNKIINLIKEFSVIRNLAMSWPMKEKIVTVPKVTSGANAYWIDENAQITPQSDPVFGQMSIQAYKLAALTLVSSELLEDSDPSIDTILYQLFALGQIRAEETAFLTGAAGSGDPILGIYNQVGIPTIPFSGALLDDIADTIASVEDYDGTEVSVLCNGKTKNQIRKLKDDNGDYIYAKPEAPKFPATIWEYPLFKDKYISKTLGAGADESYMIAGDFSYAYIGDRKGIVISSDMGGKYFEYDQMAFKAIKRVGFGIADVTKFARLTGIR